MDNMNFEWHEILGSLGVGMIIIAYILLQTERIKSENFIYSLTNAIGASLIMVSLYFNFNFPAFIVEFFWLLISLFGIGKYLSRTKA